jgi:hypothetical protein
MFLVYVDDAILVSPSKRDTEKEKQELQKYFNISNEGKLNDHV